jgi:tetratricopeptide (TPR) repeat protein
MEGFSIFELFKDTERRFHSWAGLMLGLLLGGAVTYAASTQLGPLLKVGMISIWGDISDNIFSYIHFGIYILVFSGTFIVWIYKRKIPSFKEEKVGILFSTRNPDGLAQEVLDLKAGITEALKEHDLLNQIELKDLPANIKIDSPRDAFSVINTAQGKLLIWGTFQAGQLLDRKHTGFPTINFTYRHPTNVSSHFHEQVVAGLLDRKWTYEERNDFIEKSVLANNIARVSLHIVGLTMLAWGKFREAEAILRPLDISLEVMRTQTGRPHLANFCAMVRKNRIYSLALQFSHVYDQLLWRRGIYSVTQDELKTLGAKLTEAISLSKQEHDLHHSQAVVHFLGGEIDEAIKAAKRAKKMADRANSVPDFSLGFLFLFKGDIRRGLNHYRVALGKNSRDDRRATFEIVEFLRQVLENHPEKIQFHYAMGMINEGKLDPTIAREDYTTFVEKAQNHPHLAMFCDQAKLRLKMLNAPDIG